MHFRLHRQFFPVLPFALVAHPSFGLSDPTLGVDTARGVTTTRRMRRSVRQRRHGDPLTKSKRFGQPRCWWSRTEFGAARGRALTQVHRTDGDVTTESGIRIEHKTQVQAQEGIRNPGSRGKRDYIRIFACSLINSGDDTN